MTQAVCMLAQGYHTRLAAQLQPSKDRRSLNHPRSLFLCSEGVLGWLMLDLGQHHSVQEKLRADIKQALKGQSHKLVRLLLPHLVLPTTHAVACVLPRNVALQLLKST